MIQAVGFDLDNTLYDQSQHTLSFLREAAEWLELETGVPAPAAREALAAVLECRTCVYGRLFDDALQILGIERGDRVAELVRRYHGHRADLELYPGVRETLRRLAGSYRLFVVTDGAAETQRIKVDALEIAHFFDGMVYTGEMGPGWTKPSTLPFVWAAEEIEVDPEDCVYVGDNPGCDFAGAREAGMKTIRVKTGPYAAVGDGQSQADYAVRSTPEVEGVLELLQPGVCVS